MRKVNTKQMIYGMKCTQYYKIHNTEYKTIFIQNTEQI